MEKSLTPPPLRYILVSIISILVVALLILDKGFEIAFEQPSRVERQQVYAARQMVNKVQKTLSASLAYDTELKIARQVISTQGSDPNVEILILLNHAGLPVFPGKGARERAAEKQLLMDFDLDLYQKAKLQQRTILEKSASGDVMHLYAPIPMTDQADGSTSWEVGGLYLSYDLGRAKQTALQEALAPIGWINWLLAISLSCIAIFYLLKYWVADPLSRIGNSIGRVLHGDKAVTTGLGGASEIALLGQGVESISRAIDASRMALQRANLDLEKRVEERTQHLEREIHFRRNLERALRIHEHQMQIVFNTVSEGIALWDAEGRLLYANPGFRKLLGMCRTDSRFGLQESDLKLMTEEGEPLPLEEFPIIKTLSDLQPREGVVIGVEHQDAHQRWLNINVVPVTEVKGGAITGIVSSVSDITALKHHENQLEQMANFDLLTGLPNRRLLHDRMKQLAEQTLRKGRVLAVCYLDLDGFKHINDTYGHKAGDGLLLEAASRFVNSVRAGDTVARLGGDEFVVLLVDVEDERECATIMERILTALSAPYTIAGVTETGISVSAGITLFPADNRDPDTLLRHADQAMYTAKRSGKNRYQWFTPSVVPPMPVGNSLLKEMARALTRHEFILHYQPRIHCRNGSIVAAEALLRWQHPTDGNMQPAQFVAQIEEQEIALKIGQKLIQEALTQAFAWRHQGYSFPVSVNLFTRQLQQADFLAQLKRMLQLFDQVEQIPLELEIADSLVLEGIRDLPELIRRCRALGITFTLDDFGKASATLEHLRRIPAHSLKIDESCVRNLLTGSAERKLVERAIGLGRELNRKVIAVGVENQAQLRWLRDSGCDEIQGFLIAKPMESQTFNEWLRHYRPNRVWFDL